MLLSVLWLFLGLSQLSVALRYRGPQGRERLLAADERRVQGAHQAFTGKLLLYVGVNGAVLAALGLVFALLDLSPVRIALWTVAAVAFVASLRLRGQARSTVVAVFEERELKPVITRESSAKRDRLLMAFGILALMAFVIEEVGGFLARRQHEVGWEALSGLGTLLLLVALPAMLFVNAWHFGDEQRPSRAG